MSVYSPTNVALIEELERFYDDLRTAIHHVPAHNFLIILGDFNARLGPEDAPFTYHTNTNRNGEHLAALLTEHELLAANTLFRKRMGKRWAFRTSHQYAASTGLHTGKEEVEEVHPECRVLQHVRLCRLRSPCGCCEAAPEPEGPQECPEARPDWEAFAGSPELQANYTAEVRGRLHLLAEEGSQRPTSGSSPPAKRQPGNGYRRRGDIEPPLGPNTGGCAARTRVEEARRSFEREGTAESQEELNGAKQQLFSTYDRIKGEELMEKVKKVETVHGERRYKESWKVIKRDEWAQEVEGGTAGRLQPRGEGDLLVHPLPGSPRHPPNSGRS
ncbi:hypothetical protein AAFF_G00354800 [Aldrovandia affinis]|uniref:Endonuclease/exonuclease/phosphatase domain-containing protein n=1 Tax=Aldrovandia affinis TaxID=143900 RepID=A0AAD7SJ62_9TELE|nr:hypothetical protein AAFF_G00354800 [Aldrovandia affinis]